MELGSWGSLGGREGDTSIVREKRRKKSRLTNRGMRTWIWESVFEGNYHQEAKNKGFARGSKPHRESCTMSIFNSRDAARARNFSAAGGKRGGKRQ